MIIFLSGPYGVGKSAVAEVLSPRLNALVFDAEAVGNAVRGSYPDWPCGAVFEDYPLWADFCAALLRDLHHRYGRDILVPMTLMRPSSRANLIDRLTAQGVPTRLIVLTASYKTVHDRILHRGEDENCWCMQHIEEARAATLNLGGIPVDTEGRTVNEVAEHIQTILRKKMPD